MEPITVSYSQVRTWQSCKEEFYFKYILKLQPIEETSSIRSGNNGHEILKLVYKELQRGATKKEALEVMIDFVKTHEDLSIEVIMPYTLVDQYIRFTELEELHLIDEMLEFSLVDGINVKFAPDLLIGRTVEDTKFVSRAWSRGRLSRYSQIPLYILFLREMGYEVDKGLLRFFFVKWDKQGRPKEYKPMELKIYNPNDYELAVLRREFVQSAREIQAYKNLSKEEQLATAVKTLNDSLCQWCHFSFPCSLKAQGKDISKTLKNLYVSRDLTGQE